MRRPVVSTACSARLNHSLPTSQLSRSPIGRVLEVVVGLEQLAIDDVLVGGADLLRDGAADFANSTGSSLLYCVPFWMKRMPRITQW